MSKISIYIYLLFIILISSVFNAVGQEFDGPLLWNPLLSKKAQIYTPVAKKTATDPLSLPFFEDFTGYGLYPDSTRWTDFQVYINNTMCTSPVSRGVATFDALDKNGIPYDSFSNSRFRYSDSLTSQPINLDLGTVTPGDSVYFSFYYQPQGNGFYPQPLDSLMLYFKTRFGGYIKVWSAPGSSVLPFQVMVPITDSLFFDSAFQFRFVNVAANFWADAIWNVDYIRLDRNRNINDTAINDLGFSSNPSFLLNDYTSMPYRQFYANPSGETAAQYRDSIHNHNNSAQSVIYGYSAIALNNSATLQTPVTNTATIGAYGTRGVTLPAYTATIAPPSANATVIFENTFFIQSGPGTGNTANDTIVKRQVFDNYLAYDDGSAEKSYYLKLFSTLPGKLVVEHHLNQPDTLRGMAIYFGRQIPFATYKSFSLVVYSALAGVNGAPADVKLYQEDLYSAGYADSNHFWNYTFAQPLVLPAGTFYAGTIQPAQSGSDSLYFGLDVNRIGTNHAYFNVLNSWSPSLISGAIMMRPILGQHVNGTGITGVTLQGREWQVMPNPASNVLQFEFEGESVDYRITDVQGHTILNGNITGGKSVDISRLASGMYFVQLISKDIPSAPKKIIKL